MISKNLSKIFARTKYTKILIDHFEKPRNVGTFNKTNKNI